MVRANYIKQDFKGTIAAMEHSVLRQARKLGYEPRTDIAMYDKVIEEGRCVYLIKFEKNICNVTVSSHEFCINFVHQRCCPELLDNKIRKVSDIIYYLQIIANQQGLVLNIPRHLKICGDIFENSVRWN